jgi:hypothetical protein
LKFFHFLVLYYFTKNKYPQYLIFVTFLIFDFPIFLKTIFDKL